MIDQWFMHFGGIALLLAFAAFFVTRFAVNRHPSRNSDDKQGGAFATLGIGAIGAVALFVALVLVLFGLSGAIPGWIGFALIGMAVGLSKSTD